MVMSAPGLAKPFGATETPLFSGFGIRACVACVLVAALGFLSSFDFLLFHMLAEMVTVLVSLLVFTVALGTYRFTGNNYLLVVGCGYFWVALFDLFHALAYKGMNFGSISNANLATQLWVSARLFETGALLVAPLLLSHKTAVRPAIVMSIFGWLAAAVVALLATQLFPDAYIEGQGLTPLKITTERVIVVLLILAGAGLIRNKAFFSPHTWWTLLAALVLTIITELTFTAYFTLTGPLNIMGHLTKVLSFWLVFEAIVGAMLAQPFDTLARTVRSFDAIPDPVLLVDQSGVIIQANQAALAWFGMTHHDLVGGLLRELLQAPVVPGQGLLKEGGTIGGALTRSLRALLPAQDMTVYDKDQRRVCLASTSIFSDQHGDKDDGVMVVHLRDITAQKQAEAEALLHVQRLEAVLATNEAGLWDWSITTGNVFFTPAMETMLGYDEHEWETTVRAWEERIHPDDRAAVMGDLYAHLEGATPIYDNTHRIQHKDGRWVRIRDRGQVVERDGMGRPLRAIGTHVRVDAVHIRREVSSAELSSTLERVAQTAQQEVGEPLRAALQFLGLLQRSAGHSLSSEQRSLLENAVKHGQGASAILRSLIAYGLNEASPLEIQSLCYESLLRSLGETLQPSGQTGQWLSYEPPFPAIKADRRHLHGILYVVLRTLQDCFLPQQPQKVRVRSWESGEMVVVEFAALHAALLPEQEQALFASTAPLLHDDSADAVAMTLAMAQQSLRRMGGDLTILNQSSTKEAVLFRLQLPKALTQAV